MRAFLTALIAVFVLTSSAFAGNIALDPAAGGIATASCGGTETVPGNPNCWLISGIQYLPSNAIDGDPNTKWIAPGGTTNPYLLINLGGLFTVDSITVSGVGNPGYDMNFEVFAGGTQSPGATNDQIAAALEAGSAVGVYDAVGLSGGAAWTATFSVSTSTPIEYVLYDVTLSSNGNDSGIDDAYANTISVDDPNLPEPGTFGLIGAGILALGFSRRFRK